MLLSLGAVDNTTGTSRVFAALLRREWKEEGRSRRQRRGSEGRKQEGKREGAVKEERKKKKDGTL